MTDKMLLSIISRVREGISVETSGLDIKREWWKLDKPSGEEEFVKDLTAMANAQTGDSYIVVGLGENGDLVNSPIPGDEADVQSKHKDKIEPRVRLMIDEFKVEGKTISVITIPHSKERPHVIKQYKDWHNWIPIRFGSSTLTASRSDLDEMYQERYREHESDMNVRLYEQKLRWGQYPVYGGYCFMVRLMIDNYNGGAPDYIVNAVLHSRKGKWKSKHFMFEGLALDQEMRVGPHERKQAVQLYLGEYAPNETKNNDVAPDLSKGKVLLSLYARSGKRSDLEIESGWVERKG